MKTTMYACKLPNELVIKKNPSYTFVTKNNIFKSLVVTYLSKEICIGMYSEA